VSRKIVCLCAKLIGYRAKLSRDLRGGLGKLSHLRFGHAKEHHRVSHPLGQIGHRLPFSGRYLPLMAHGLTAWCIDVDHRRRESLAYPTAASTTRCGLRPLGAGAPLLDFPSRLFGSAYPALIGGTFKMVQSLSASAMSSLSTAVVLPTWHSASPTAFAGESTATKRPLVQCSSWGAIPSLEPLYQTGIKPP